MHLCVAWRQVMRSLALMMQRVPIQLLDSMLAEIARDSLALVMQMGLRLQRHAGGIVVKHLAQLGWDGDSQLFRDSIFYTVAVETQAAETKGKLCGLNEDKRKAAEGVPEWLIVTLASEHPEGEKLFYEDMQAVACATQNFMTSLAADGVGSKWMTGALGAAPTDVLAAVGAPESEKLVGAIWYGYPAKELANDAKAPPRKKGLDGVLIKLP